MLSKWCAQQRYEIGPRSQHIGWDFQTPPSVFLNLFIYLSITNAMFSALEHVNMIIRRYTSVGILLLSQVHQLLLLLLFLVFAGIASALALLNSSHNRYLFDDRMVKGSIPNDKKCIRCAVVGNGGILNGSMMGKEIDANDYVFRQAASKGMATIGYNSK